MFSPVLSVINFNDDGEAVAIVNDVRFGRVHIQTHATLDKTVA